MGNPSLINADPYLHWIARVKPAAASDLALAGLPTGEAARAANCERAKRDNIRCRRA